MKTAIVFGASGGVGGAVTRKLLADGYFVCGAGADEAKNDALKSALANENLSLCRIDVTDPDSTRAGIAEFKRDHPKIDAVVFSVSAPIKHQSILRSDWADYANHLDVQLRGLYNAVQSLKDDILAGGGMSWVILLTEACLGKPPSGIASYITAKYALLGFAKCLAVELARYHCTVNMISPGVLKTDLTADLPSKFMEIEIENNPLGRIATTEDVAGAVVFLLSEAGGFVSGVNLPVNGGGKIV